MFYCTFPQVFAGFGMIQSKDKSVLLLLSLKAHKAHWRFTRDFHKPKLQFGASQRKFGFYEYWNVCLKKVFQAEKSTFSDAFMNNCSIVWGWRRLELKSNLWITTS